jgi:hypothetical protein
VEEVATQEHDERQDGAKRHEPGIAPPTLDRACDVSWLGMRRSTFGR